VSISSTGLHGAIWAPIKEWCEISGLGRTVTYQRIALGNLRAKKVGRRTLVHVPSGLDFIESLPDANLTTGLSRRQVDAVVAEPIALSAATTARISE
jgi:hypothetical protein